MTISVRSAHLLAVLKDPLRLTILLELEQRPRSPAELARDLSMPYDRVNWAVKSLAKGRLAVLARSEPAPGGGTMQNVYAVRCTGWAALPPVLDAIAATAED